MTILWHLNPFTGLIQHFKLLCIIGEKLEDGKSCVDVQNFKLEKILRRNSRVTDCCQCVKDSGKAKCKEGINQNAQERKYT